MPAKGSAEWKGDLKGGAGTFTAGDGISGTTRSLPVRGRARRQPRAADRRRARVVLLDGAVGRAGRRGNPGDSVKTDATVTLRFVDGAPTITAIALTTVGDVPGIDEAAFKEAAEGAKAGCPVSRALAGVPEITLDASLQ